MNRRIAVQFQRYSRTRCRRCNTSRRIDERCRPSSWRIESFSNPSRNADLLQQDLAQILQGLPESPVAVVFPSGNLTFSSPLVVEDRDVVWIGAFENASNQTQQPAASTRIDLMKNNIQLVRSKLCIQSITLFNGAVTPACNPAFSRA